MKKPIKRVCLTCGATHHEDLAAVVERLVEISERSVPRRYVEFWQVLKELAALTRKE